MFKATTVQLWKESRQAYRKLHRGSLKLLPFDPEVGLDAEVPDQSCINRALAQGKLVTWPHLGSLTGRVSGQMNFWNENQTWLFFQYSKFSLIECAWANSLWKYAYLDNAYSGYQNSEHLKSGNSLITNYHLFDIQMPSNSSLFKPWPKWITKSLLFKPSVIQPISQTTYDLNSKLLVCYSSHDLKNEPFREQTILGHSSTI